MPITALPTPPSRLDPANFSTRADDFLGALPKFVTEANTLEQSLQKYATTSVSTTSTVIGTGAKTLTAETGKAWVVGTTLIIASSANPANYMAGQVTSYNSSTGLLQINVTQSGGSGTFASWVISISAPSMTVANLSGGSMGSIPYQSGVNTTSMLSPGSVGETLISQGTSAPIWGVPGGTLTLIQWGNTGAYNAGGSRSILISTLLSIGTKYIEIEIQGGGGATSISATTAGQAVACGAGGAGGYAFFRIPISNFASDSQLMLSWPSSLAGGIGKSIAMGEMTSGSVYKDKWIVYGGNSGNSVAPATSGNAPGGAGGGVSIMTYGIALEKLFDMKGMDGSGAYWDSATRVYPARGTPSKFGTPTDHVLSYITLSSSPSTGLTQYGAGQAGGVNIGAASSGSTIPTAGFFIIRAYS